MTPGPRHRLGVTFLRVGILLTSALSVLMVTTPLPGHLFSWIALGDWSSFATRGEVGDYVDFSYAVTGAVMIGWMVALWWLVAQVHDGTPGAWRVMAVSVGGWFVIDSSTSVARGYPGNVALNIATALVFAGGLSLTRGVRTARSTDPGHIRGY